MVPQKRVLIALVALGVAAMPAGAFAQSAPGEAPPPPAPPSYARSDETIHGRVTAFDGGYRLQIRDDHGYVDNVELHPGTVINPTGVRLSPGMDVTVHGVNRGPAFAASEIDTPYTEYGAVPVYPYAAYPYPVYGYPVYAYPYPAFSIGVGFRFGGGFRHR